MVSENTIKNRELALKTKDKEEQERLSKSPDMNTRRNLGFNKFLDRSVAQSLMSDVAQNVIYVVSKNQHIPKNFSEEVLNHRCIICKETDFRNCKNCG